MPVADARWHYRGGAGPGHVRCTGRVGTDPAHHHHRVTRSGIVAQCRARNTPTIAATIGGRPASYDFESYVQRYAGNGIVKGLRQVLHGSSTPAGFCLGQDFVRGVRTLGKHDLNFELTMRPTELHDGVKLIQQCPDTRFVLDHCGNGDPKAFNTKLGPGLRRSCTAWWGKTMGWWTPCSGCQHQSVARISGVHPWMQVAWICVCWV